MKYFIDTEFLEGTQKTWFGKQTKPTIDLISIGIVAEDNREYYAISKEFNLKEAWNRYDLKELGYAINMYGDKYIVKHYWLKENVLLPIFKELGRLDVHDTLPNYAFTYNSIKRLINKYGKSNKQIAEEIKNFCTVNENNDRGIVEQISPKIPDIDRTISFYGYYADYDWVVFCWLFGKMIDLPKGFPKYCNDLKQELDRKAKNKIIFQTFEEGLKSLKEDERYPKQTNEHNALADAEWNKELYEFLNKL
jgi:hypothetical protein